MERIFGITDILYCILRYLYIACIEAIRRELEESHHHRLSLLSEFCMKVHFLRRLFICLKWQYFTVAFFLNKMSVSVSEILSTAGVFCIPGFIA